MSYCDYDEDACPTKRKELCINCNERWDYHEGWKCPTIDSTFRRKSELKLNEHYLTLDMPEAKNRTAGSIIAADDFGSCKSLTKTEETVSRDNEEQNKKEEMKFFKKVSSPNYCACGINKSNCNYHS